MLSNLISTLTLILFSSRPFHFYLDDAAKLTAKPEQLLALITPDH